MLLRSSLQDEVVEFYYSEMSDDYGFDDMYEF